MHVFKVREKVSHVPKSFVIFDGYIYKGSGEVMNSQEIKELIDYLELLLQVTDDEVIEAYNEKVRQKHFEEMHRTKSYNERHKRHGFVYVVEGLDSCYKIGMTSNPNNRLKTYTELPFETKIICLIETDDMEYLEKYFHEKLADKRIRREWFKLNESDIDWIKKFDVKSI